MKKIQENLGGLEGMILTSCYYCKKQNFQARNWLGRNGSASSRQFVSFTLGPSACQSTRQCTMQQGLSFLGKAITKCLTLEIDFSANFYLIYEFFEWGSLNLSIKGGVKLKTWRGEGFTDKRSQNFCLDKCYDICFCEKHPLTGKNASKV